MQLDNVPGYDDVMIGGTWDLVAVNLTVLTLYLQTIFLYVFVMQLDNIPGYNDVMIGVTRDLVAVNLTVFNIIFTDYISLCVGDAAR